MAEVVTIDKVISATQASRYEVRKMITVLQKQGQIEPLQVRVYYPGKFITFDCDIHAAAIVDAAKIMDWPTILISVAERYEE